MGPTQKQADADVRVVSEDTYIRFKDGEVARILIAPSGDSRRIRLDMEAGKGCVISIMAVIERPLTLDIVNRIGAGSIVNTYGLWLSEGRCKVVNSLEGDKSQAHEIQIFVARGKSKLRLGSELRHIGKGTSGDIAVKGVVKDEASADLAGLIRISKSGAGARSFLSEHAILLSPHAHASANPELEIDNNDVASRHSASVSKIDERKIFYLMTRGLAREEARDLIVEGFLGSAIDKISDEGMRDRISSKAFSAL